MTRIEETGNANAPAPGTPDGHTTDPAATPQQPVPEVATEPEGTVGTGMSPP